MPAEQELTGIIKECLRKSFPLYDLFEDRQHLSITKTDGKLFLTYNPSNTWPPLKLLEDGRVIQTTILGLQIEKELGYITELIIDTENRRKGYGKALLLAAEEFMKKIGCKRIIVSASGETTKKFYQAMGFFKLEESELVFGKLI